MLAPFPSLCWQSNQERKRRKTKRRERYNGWISWQGGAVLTTLNRASTSTYSWFLSLYRFESAFCFRSHAAWCRGSDCTLHNPRFRVDGLCALLQLSYVSDKNKTQVIKKNKVAVRNWKKWNAIVIFRPIMIFALSVLGQRVQQWQTDRQMCVLTKKIIRL